MRRLHHYCRTARATTWVAAPAGPAVNTPHGNHKDGGYLEPQPARMPAHPPIPPKTAARDHSSGTHSTRNSGISATRRYAHQARRPPAPRARPPVGRLAREADTRAADPALLAAAITCAPLPHNWLPNSPAACGPAARPTYTQACAWPAGSKARRRQRQRQRQRRPAALLSAQQLTACP